MTVKTELSRPSPAHELSPEDLDLVSGGSLFTARGLATGATAGGVGFVMQQASIRGGIFGASVGGVPGFLVGAAAGAVLGYVAYKAFD